MKKNKKHCAVVMAITGNKTFSLANVLIGLMKHSPNFADDIIIYSNDISEKDKKVLKKIFPVKIKKYKFQLLSKDNQIALDVFTSMAYARYECFKLLAQYENVVWLDTDILIRRDISGILHYAQQTGICLRGAISNSIKCNFIEGAEKLINMDGGVCCNSGIFALNDKLPNYKEITKWCYEKTELLKDYLLAADQGIIGLIIPHFNLQFTILPIEYNVFTGYTYEVKNVVIEHAYGPEKYWNFFDDPEWDDNYIKWLSLGGSPCEDKKLRSLFGKLVYQKTLKKIQEHELRWGYFFIQHLIYKYGREAVVEAYCEFVKAVLTGKLKTNDPEYERILTQNFEYFSSNLDYSQFL